MSEQQYVVFKLSHEDYALNIMNVTEIIPFEESVKLPHVPHFVEGIINYRGSVIPIICLKKRFHIPLGVADHSTRIIIISMDDKQVGFIVDEASQTLKIDDEQIDITRNISSNIDMKYINGVAKIDDKLVILVDLERILTEEEKEEIENL